MVPTKVMMTHDKIHKTKDVNLANEVYFSISATLKTFGKSVQNGEFKTPKMNVLSKTILFD
jgi:hypothetical protein